MLVLVTYATDAYQPSAELMMFTALQVGKFDKVLMYTDEDIRNPGNYEWKPAAILKAAEEECNCGDVLVYCDATMQWCRAFDSSRVEDIALFQIGDAEEKGYSNIKYTKPECLEAMEATEEERKAWQINAAIQAYRLDTRAMFFLEKYRQWCSKSQCVAGDAKWPLHRHDQSILTVLSVRYGIHPFPDITQHGGEQHHVFHHRVLYKRMQTVVVVTPTTGRNLSHLLRCIRSVAVQDVVCLRHLVVCDGPDATRKTQHLRRQVHNSRLQWLDLPYNTGGNRWNGHRIYGAAPFLAQAAHAKGPAEMIAYLDEDNYYEPTHLQLLVDKLLNDKLDAVHSLRNIVFQNGRVNLNTAGDTFICKDNCESLGHLAPSVPGGYFLADTSTWLLTHRAAVESSKCWDVQARDPRKEEADRALTAAMMRGFRIGAVKQHTLNYTAGSGALSVDPSFFINGNTSAKYAFEQKPCLYLFHFSAEQTRRALASQHDTSRSFLLDEWNQGQCRQLHKSFNLINGFDFGECLPSGATVLVHICHREELPLAMLAKRTDLHRILYTAESPNIRHTLQWTWGFLKNVADDVVTYWNPMLDSKTDGSLRLHACRHQCHHYDCDNPQDRLQLRTNKGVMGSVGMVLENRPDTTAYEINGVELQNLDGMREKWAQRLCGMENGLRLTVHGKGWQESPLWTVGSTVGKQTDTRHAVDILQEYSACLIVENCNADGYVSEKIYDSLIAGSVPIFYNAHDTFLPDDVYFNLATSSLSSITPDSIRSKQRAVYDKRIEILEGSGSAAYAKVIKEVARAGKGPC